MNLQIFGVNLRPLQGEAKCSFSHRQGALLLGEHDVARRAGLACRSIQPQRCHHNPQLKPPCKPACISHLDTSFLHHAESLERGPRALARRNKVRPLTNRTLFLASCLQPPSKEPRQNDEDSPPLVTPWSLEPDFAVFEHLVQSFVPAVRGSFFLNGPKSRGPREIEVARPLHIPPRIGAP